MSERTNAMIGLEYILGVFNMQHQDLANELGIKKQNINLWVKGKQKIPQKYLPILSNMFGLSEEDLQRELSDIDKLAIQNDVLLSKIVAKELNIKTLEEYENRTRDIEAILENADTDPRFLEVYRNSVYTSLLFNLETIKKCFIDIQNKDFDDEQEKTNALDTFLKIIIYIIVILTSSKIDNDEFLEYLLRLLQKNKADDSD